MEILARAVGRRKEAVAQVQIIRGTGKFIINDKIANEYLHNNSCSLLCVKGPFEIFAESPLVLSSQPPILKSKEIPLNLTERNVQDIGVPPSIQGAIPINSKNSVDSGNGTSPILSKTSPLGFPITEQDSKKEVSVNNLLEFNLETFDTIVKVKGGGLIGQAEAIKLGVARALCEIKSLSNSSDNTENSQISVEGSEIRKQLKIKGYLTQDSRVKERRKYGLKKARKASQYHKR